MKITHVQPIEVRLKNMMVDPMIAIVVYNIISDDSEVVATKRIEINVTGYTMELLKVIMSEFSKTIESNDRINSNHELYPDMENPKQVDRKIKKIDSDLRHKFKVPKDMMEMYDRLQDKEHKGSGKPK